MKPPPDRRPIFITTRRPINWRIPIELLERVDALRKRRPRTDVVVEALVSWCRKEER